MTNQEKKEKLKELANIDRRIEYLTREKKRWMERACSITTSLSWVPHSRTGPDRLGSLMAKFEKIETELDKQIAEYTALREKLEEAIRAMPDPTLQELLRLRYIDRCTWERISVELHYDYEGKNVYRMHGRALSMLEI